jgi:hypothetical protein
MRNQAWHERHRDIADGWGDPRPIVPVTPVRPPAPLLTIDEVGDLIPEQEPLPFMDELPCVPQCVEEPLPSGPLGKLVETHQREGFTVTIYQPAFVGVVSFPTGEQIITQTHADVSNLRLTLFNLGQQNVNRAK